MKIAVVAAQGRAGRAFVRAALTAGHQVHAGILGQNPFPDNANLKVMQCDATKASDVRQLITGQDAVVSLIGHAKKLPSDVQTVAIHVLVTQMAQYGPRRIVSLTGTGVRFPGDVVPTIDKVLNTAIAIIDPARVADGRNHAHVLHQSNLDWTIIRALKLTNGDVHGFNLRAHGPTKWWVARTEVAQAILQVLENKSFMRQAPIISR